MKSNIKSISIFLDEGLANWLLSKANEWHTSPSSVIRYLILEYQDAIRILEDQNYERSEY